MIYRSILFASIAVAAAFPSLAQAREFPLAPGQTAVGTIGEYTTQYKDTLLDIARDNDLGYTQLAIANRGIDPWLPGADKRIVLPSLYILPDVPRRGIVVNLAQQRAFYFPPGGHKVETFPIGVGVQGRKTPLGVTRIVGKEPHPGWSPPPSIRAEEPDLPAYVPPGPDNPLGDYAMPLAWKGYLMHGTSKPYGVGRNVSHGCIRLYPEDIDHLFHEVAVGTPVRVINDAVSVGWINNRLYVGVFPDKEQVDQIDIEQPMTPAMPPDLVQRVRAAAGDQADRVDWALVTRLGMVRNGIPTAVTPPVVAEDSVAPADNQAPDEDIAPAAMTMPPEQSEPQDQAPPQTDVTEEQTGQADDGASIIDQVIASFPQSEK